MFPHLCRATEQDTFRKLYRCVVHIKMRTLYIIRPRNTEYLYSQRWSCYEIAPATTPFNILIDDNSSHYNIITWIPAPDACLHEHNNTSYAAVAGKNLLTTSDYSWKWTSGCWQVLQLYGCFRQRAQFVFLELGFQCFFIFFKIGSFKKKEIINIPQMLSSGWLVNASGAADKHRQKTWWIRISIFELCVLKVRYRIWWQKNKDVWHMSVSAMCLSI